jgi:hypothetical protein
MLVAVADGSLVAVFVGGTGVSVGVAFGSSGGVLVAMGVTGVLVGVSVAVGSPGAVLVGDDV